MDDNPVLEALTVENRAWIETLMIPSLLKHRNPAEFLWILCYSLFPAVHSNRDDEKDLLKDVHAILEIYGVSHPADLSPILLPQDSGNWQGPAECLNAVVESTRKFLKSDEVFRRTLADDLDTRSQRCKDLSAELDAVTKENSFYHEKLLRLERLVNSLQENGSTRWAIEQCIEDFYEDV